MEQSWLFFSLLGLITGFGLLVALVVLRRLVPIDLPPVFLVIIAFIASGVSSLVGIYLEVTGIPGSILPYRLINAAAWAVAVYAPLFYLSVESSRMKIHQALPWTVGALVLVLTFLTAHSPQDDGVLEAVFPSSEAVEGFRSFSMLAVEIAVGVLSIFVAVKLIARADKTACRPWRVVFRGIGIAIFILIPANLVDFIVSLIFSVRGTEMQDGFFFAFGYGIANIALIAVLLEALRDGGRRGEEENLSRRLARAYGLTRREAEIAEKVLSGAGDREIAGELFISPRTVDSHMRNIFRKCGVRSRMQLSRRLAAGRVEEAGE